MSKTVRDKLKDPYFASEPDVIDDNGYTGFAVGNDLNREVIKPETNEDLPNGAIGVRTDDDFWVVGMLPYEEFKDVSMADIANEFWSDLTDITCKPDSGDPWWDEYWKRGK